MALMLFVRVSWSIKTTLVRVRVKSQLCHRQPTCQSLDPFLWRRATEQSISFASLVHHRDGSTLFVDSQVSEPSTRVSKEIKQALASESAEERTGKFSLSRAWLVGVMKSSSKLLRKRADNSPTPHPYLSLVNFPHFVQLSLYVSLKSPRRFKHQQPFSCLYRERKQQSKVFPRLYKERTWYIDQAALKPPTIIFS